MRVILIVLDSVGVGELPDADKYGDLGSNTLMNVARTNPDMDLKHMTALGLGSIQGLDSLSKEKVQPTGCFGRLSESSNGKDTTTGHWEIAGIITEIPMPTYPNGFPSDVVSMFEEKTGRKIIGNCTASGTEIIQKFGDVHVKTGNLIVYTSADSVFQIAAHESVIPIEEQYRICRMARNMLTGQHAVSRVIARPFTGEAGNYTRTKNRKDFSLSPTGVTILDCIKKAQLEVAAVGKIEDIFAGKGVTKAVHIENNMDGVEQTIKYMKTDDSGLIFTNLVDFDMLFGHRNDSAGYANALQEFDDALPRIINALRDDDLLIITADHGCDPTTPSTDHSREYIPVLAYGKRIKTGVDIGTRKSFADIGATVLAYLNVPCEVKGESFLGEILK